MIIYLSDQDHNYPVQHLNTVTYNINTVSKYCLLISIFLSLIPFYGYTQTVYFQSILESGDLSEWKEDQSGGIYYEPYVAVTTEVAHSGNYSIRCALPDPAVAYNAKLIRWRINKKNAYYSAWYYFDEDYKCDYWSNIMQWKTQQPQGQEPRAGDIEPTFIIEVLMRDNIRQLILYHWSVGEGYLPHEQSHPQQTDNGFYRQSEPIALSDTTWIHIEAYYKTDRINGQIIVWQNGIEVFNIDGVNTQDSVEPSDFVMFGVGNYISPTEPKNQILYVDDIMVTDYRVSAEILNIAPKPPKNFRILD